MKRRHPGTRVGARARARQAFTLLEIMLALGVMTIASMAIIQLQGHTLRANAHARQLAIGMQIAQMWIERFKQDAHTWNQAGIVAGTPTPAAVLAGTTYLRTVSTSPGVFQQIPSAVVVDATLGFVRTSNGYDYQGAPLVMDGGTANATLNYCVSFRPTWVITGRALRTDVRVWWPREASNASMALYATNNCADDNATLSPGGASANTYHFAYLSTVIGLTAVIR